LAKLIINDEEINIDDGSKIVDTIEEAGIPIGCSNGVCGTCEIEVTEGMANFNELSEAEEDLGMEGNKRLGCQCEISSGTVKLSY